MWRAASVVLWMFGVSQGNAQSTATVCVRDGQGLAVAGAVISRGAAESGEGRALTDGDGCAGVGVAAAGYARGVLRVGRDGFLSATVSEPEPGQRVSVVLQAAGARQSVTVTADRGLVGVTDEATSVAVLSRQQLENAPGLSLDDSLHQVAGFQLFRRTSSWTANPTTEGISLRGLGSTAASRTLVVTDEVPLNDPFGGWIHWDEIPALAVADVVAERGGSADLYGSSAIGGVIAIDPVRPAKEGVRVAADGLGAAENSGAGDLLVTAGTPAGDVLAAGSGLSTAGYVTTAPAARGLVDTQSSVAEESGRLEWGMGLGGRDTNSGSPTGTTKRTAGGTPNATGSVFLRGNVLNEERGNGTPDQTNGTRLWRYLAGGDLAAGQGHAGLRVFGDRETYRQSFSAIATSRNSETLTRLQRVPVDEFGFSASGEQALHGGFTAGVGLDLRDIRATDAETPVSGGAGGATTAISARQRELGGYLQAIWQKGGWSAAGSVRVDNFRTFDGRSVTQAHPSPAATDGAQGVVAEPEVNEVVASPHLGVVRQVGDGLALTANAFRAFRGPTMNELYRTGQVGQQTTLANPSLVSERATGFELGGEFADMRLRGRPVGRLRASYFWTEVNRPVSTVLLSETAATQTLQRQNLGQIRSRGLSLEGATASWRGFDLGVGWQMAVATVTRFQAGSSLQANLAGKWLPEVPREMVTATANYVQPRWISLYGVVSYTGRTFDDSANQFALSPYARVDVSAERALRWGLSLTAGAQNLLDRTIQAGRTPVLTLAAPRLVEGGLRWRTGH